MSNLNDVMLVINGLRNLRWPIGITYQEVMFNRESLLGILRSTEDLNDIQIADQKLLRSSIASPFFGWGACSISNGRLKIRGQVKTDLTFKKGACTFFAENKLVNRSRECNIKNSLVQAVEYLNLYSVDLGIVLIFDAGRGKDADWQQGPEWRLIQTLIAAYPICVVRVRENHQTVTYFSSTQIGTG